MSQELITVQPVDRDDDWWVERHKAKLALVAAGNVDLVMLGDSITHAWENKGKPTFDKYYADRSTLNLGYSGDRTEHVLWRLQHGELEGLQPKVIVLMIGTNNTGHRQDAPEATAAGIRAILGELKSRIPTAKVLLLGVFPRGESASDPLRILNRQINEIVSQDAEADERVVFLDIAEVFTEEDGQLKKELMPDLLHPSAEGYAFWAAAMEPTLARLLGTKAVE